MSNAIRTYLGQSTVHHKVSRVDEAALVAGKEEHCLGLLDGLAETTRGEVDLAAVALGLVVAQPVLKQRSAVHVLESRCLPKMHSWSSLLEWCRAQ